MPKTIMTNGKVTDVKKAIESRMELYGLKYSDGKAISSPAEPAKTHQWSDILRRDVPSCSDLSAG